MSEPCNIEITAFDWVPDFARGYVRDLRLRWACNEIGLPYRTRLISAAERPEWYFREQPWGQVPYMTDGDMHLFESGACLVHLAEKNNALLAASGQARADALSWLFAALNSLEPLNFEMGRAEIFAKGEKWAKLRKPSLMEEGKARYRRLADAVAGREWLAGDFSIADIMMATVLRDAARAGFLDGLSILSDYLDRATARSAFEAALDEQLADFADVAPAKT